MVAENAKSIQPKNEDERGADHNRHSSAHVWKSYLYQLQEEAPKPIMVECGPEPHPDCPDQYSIEYHGAISRHMCTALLTQEGHYLVRESQKPQDCHTLTLRFGGAIKHYRLYYDNNLHYVGEKRFDSVEDLVADGLVTLYMESKAGHQLRSMATTASYIDSPHYTLSRPARISTLNNKHVIRTDDTQAHISKPSSSLSSKEENALILPQVLHPEDTQPCDQPQTSQRPHRFIPHTFTGLHWCGFCGHFLWGLVMQGVRCQDCFFKAHRQCSLKVPSDCCPHLRHLHSVFGADLTTCIRSGGGGSNSDSEVPWVVEACIAEMEARGLTMEGIYRVPGSQDQIDALRLAFERDGAGAVNIGERSVPDVNVVAGILKLYLRLLPLPLITTNCFNQLCGAYSLSDPEARLLAMRNALYSLPSAHHATLRTVIQHLARVCEHSAVNKMTATSLSTVFAPTLIQTSASHQHLQPADLLALANSSQEPRVIECCLIYHRELFKKES
ncbi:unnamed protein product [Meganyctiphanes norvegica]|uniref:N-chimaerin n=1 Tax=Meganyctiphanes norvegica TaxID=48144 RepID=A0AAV2Q471_MEGNR